MRTILWWGALMLLVVIPVNSLRRHERHRREPKARAEVLGLSDREIKEEQAENKYKPEFERCNDYNPEVKEESQTGTQFFRVHAIDKDGQESPNGQVKYSIVSTHNKFVIDPNTGWLSTNAPFNRDEPEREKLVHVTVKASDNGRPQLEDVCTLAVRVLDINDNSPVFDRANYDVGISRDTVVGTQILRVSATDVDEGDNQKIAYELLATRIPNDIEYFSWVWNTGIVTLKKSLKEKPIGYIFELKAIANDHGDPQKKTEIDVTLEVKESNNKPPSFMEGPGSEIAIPESYNDFQKPIARYTARSNIPDDENVFFQLINGRTDKTNKDGTFRAVQDPKDPKAVNIYLAKALEYEKVSSYTLTLQVRNSPDLVAEAQLTVNIEDVNNQAPIFTNVESGNVLEHEAPGTPVMTVSAVDNDGTYPNNQVMYRISARNPKNIRDKFEINMNTGAITTKVEFDREVQSVYAVTIEAYDGSPSSLLQNGEPNSTPQKFRIAIADKNDNPPYFPQQVYYAEVKEDEDVNSKVIEVTAEDKDTEASITTYNIISGDPGKAFKIEEQTGFIRVAKPLDYEAIKEYRLVVGAWDGQFSSNTTVNIKINNVNDMKPEFEKPVYKVSQTEEYVPDFAIVKVRATDPDLADKSIDQNITYALDPKSPKSQYFHVNEHTGDVRIIKKLDRDLPDGYPVWSTYILAKDENGQGLESFVQLEVILEDINDNAPFLDMDEGLVWTENQQPGLIGVLKADDYDEPENGPPFYFEIARDADLKIKQWFDVERLYNGTYAVKALTQFDRERQKYHYIPINICDNTQDQCAVSTLKLTIGDVNDNPMKPGKSEIFVYNYDGRAPDTIIGRVYVEDPDDWDLPDKTFRFKNEQQWRGKFDLNRGTGEITMLERISLPRDINTFQLEFIVEDPTHGQTGRNAVEATVNVTIKKISDEAVMKSGSIRVKGVPEEFIESNVVSGISKREKFKDSLTKLLGNGSIVDVFTVLGSGTKKNPYTDIRFSAHGSPFYAPEKMEGVLVQNRKDIEKDLDVEIVMVHIDECLIEGQHCERSSCANVLDIEDSLVTIVTNKTSFVGVQAKVIPQCRCSAKNSYSRFHSSCNPNPCLNNGTCQLLPAGGYKCNCPNQDQFGPNCERLAASFNGKGWSWHKGLEACGDSHINLIFNTGFDSGTLLYTGPSPNNIIKNVTDYLSLELIKGKLTMKINFGAETKLLHLHQRVDDSKDHYLAIRWTNDTVQMELDDKSCSNAISLNTHQNCFVQISTHDSTHHYINTNGPLQVGGVSFGNQFDDLALALGLDRAVLPNGDGFAGCIKNLTFTADGKKTFYNLGSPADGENFTPGCNEEFVAAVTATNLNMNFLIAIIVCIAIILIAVVGMAVYRRKRHVFGDKDIDCDIRENIINYEDEGGGEGDQTGYDLSVLRMMSDGTPALHAGHVGHDKIPYSPYDAPDIQTFLQTNKDRIDLDPDATPYDDLRHYAYEGDGNSGGSLSSLNSGTSDGDLEFDYLHNFGPRFKKLADMYGEEPDSDDEPPPPPPPLPSESWC